jgi:hypothetical protein
MREKNYLLLFYLDRGQLHKRVIKLPKKKIMKFKSSLLMFSMFLKNNSGIFSFIEFPIEKINKIK